ncbi:MAG: hypothetical protein JJ927_12745 [Balneola sp.]|nr:hypothetical protein [Balneola sp.]MBO6651893.1 hypothetical protein [Balneola sp.]MBO6709996.1 hypothetical protein [Balneola sp.]MBO6869794.1 hypothetical protein [Balneola sp.]
MKKFQSNLYLYDMNDRDFLLQFGNCTLPPELFDHKAHLRLAWLQIKQHGLDRALENCCEQISRFASFHGDHQKFNKTITNASVYAVNHFMKDETSFEEFIEKNPQLLSDLKTLINSHYSYDIFTVENARKIFIEPDVQPFI